MQSLYWLKNCSAVRGCVRLLAKAVLLNSFMMFFQVADSRHKFPSESNWQPPGLCVPLSQTARHWHTSPANEDVWHIYPHAVGIAQGFTFQGFDTELSATAHYRHFSTSSHDGIFSACPSSSELTILLLICSWRSATALPWSRGGSRSASCGWRRHTGGRGAGSHRFFWGSQYLLYF